MSIEIILDNNVRLSGHDLESVVNTALTGGAKFVHMPDGRIIYDWRNNRHFANIDEFSHIIDLCANGTLPLSIWFYKADNTFRVLDCFYNGTEDDSHYTVTLFDGTHRKVDKRKITNVVVNAT